MNLVSQSVTPSGGIVVITTSGREYAITPQMLRAAYLAAKGTEEERKAAAVAACKAVRGILRQKDDRFFAVRYRDKEKELVALGKEAQRSKAERDAASDEESAFLSPALAWTITFDPTTGDIDPARTGYEVVQ